MDNNEMSKRLNVGLNMIRTGQSYAGPDGPCNKLMHYLEQQGMTPAESIQLMCYTVGFINGVAGASIERAASTIEANWIRTGALFAKLSMELKARAEADGLMADPTIDSTAIADQAIHDLLKKFEPNGPLN